MINRMISQARQLNEPMQAEALLRGLLQARSR
jgi:hypothetical protein